LRWKDDVRRLWVDALCIDQKDDIEKSHQVAQMGRVYSKTTQTNARLGEDEKGYLATNLAKRIHESGSIESLKNLCLDEPLQESWVRFNHELVDI
jgi:hypothetical protein